MTKRRNQVVLGAPVKWQTWTSESHELIADVAEKIRNGKAIGYVLLWIEPQVGIYSSAGADEENMGHIFGHFVQPLRDLADTFEAPGGKYGNA
jgi:hypothetical protein